VALDATALLGPRTGIGEFCFRVLQALAARPGLSVGAFAMTWRGRHGLAAELPPGVEVLGAHAPAVPARLLHASWAHWPVPHAELLTEGLTARVTGRARRLDVVHGTNFVVPPTRRAAMVVTVHDLTPLRFPEWCRPAALAFPALVKKAVKRGAWVHTDSEFVAEEVVELLGAPRERVRAVHLGVMPGPKATGTAGTGEVAPGEARNGPVAVLPDWVKAYVLALGTVEPRKDLPGLVRAFGLIAGRAPGLALVLAGPDGWGTAALEEAIAACPARQRVVRLGWVPATTRDTLLTGATVFAYPSRYEGFGLPPLQAMAAGVPVVATSCGALHEVLGDAARLVGPGDVDALAGALEDLVLDKVARGELAAKGLERASGYTWQACGAGLASLYHEAAEA
jgi:glycosyltransferase involved in cell wall biosynthesis